MGTVRSRVRRCFFGWDAAFVCVPGRQEVTFALAKSTRARSPLPSLAPAAGIVVCFRVTNRLASAQNFEEAKRALGGFHFVAVQDNPDADDVAGFWLLKEVRM